jgi:hypothetical protein
MIKHELRTFFTALLAMYACTSHAAPIDSQSILVSHITGNGRGEIIEFSRTGTVLQSFLVPTGTGSVVNGDLRALEMDKYGRLQIFNGTFSPYLTTLTPQVAPGVATFEHHTIAGWSVVGNTSYGAVAIDAARGKIYVNDMSTASPGGPTGIIGFDSNTYSATRVKSGEYTKVALGLDGLLYASFPATMPGNNKLDVIDPTNYSVLRTVTLPTNGLITYAGFAADGQGNIYATEGREWGSGISKFSPQGTLIKHLSINVSNPWLHDLALSPDGMLVTLSHFGDVAVTTTDLASFTTFRNSSLGTSDHTFVAWAVATVPEPGTLWLFVCGSLVIGARRQRVRCMATKIAHCTRCT